ncbi:PREDICTED: uncharacterized protein LOC105448775 isoform X2 [Wasmannia auropunctata]|uniref:uncharacterized protein LOC105448775 isoform X2 n=1 Tax=Wasmannia auropunctata TaxID=64793 RepID=UPI0005F059A9|nr:PREDICTED: uncharacterized protein LOC105448775 isoform X2 [Wasmannia auropunctata]
MRRAICKYVSLACVLVALVRGGEACKSDRVEVEKVTDAYGLSEGPHWDHRTQKLYFVDIYNQYIRRLDPATGDVKSVHIDHGPIGVVIPVDDTTDQFVAGAGKDVVLVTWDADEDELGNVTVLCSLDSAQSDTRVNDGKVDSYGRFWLGTMGNEVNGVIAPNLGTLYRVDDKLKPMKEISPVSISNGLAWNIEDNTFYYIDSPTRQVAAYDYDPNSGTISNKRIVFNLNTTNLPGVPDGMTIDTDGNLWIALYGGHHVPIYSGARKPLINEYETDNFFGDDGFGDFNFTKKITAKIDRSKHASVLLVDLVKRYPGEITLITLGPLTTVATAIALEPNFLHLTKQHIIMGASVKPDEVEFNFKQDPESNWMALNNVNKPSIIFPIDTVMSHAFPLAEYRILFNDLDKSTATFLHRTTRKALENANNTWQPADGMTMAIALEPNIITRYYDTNLTPVLAGDARGAIVINSTSEVHNARIVQSIDKAAFKRLILKYLSK